VRVYEKDPFHLPSATQQRVFHSGIGPVQHSGRGAEVLGPEEEGKPRCEELMEPLRKVVMSQRKIENNK